MGRREYKVMHWPDLRSDAKALKAALAKREQLFVGDVLQLTTGLAYVEKLLQNRRISGYLSKHHGDALQRLQKIIDAVREQELALVRKRLNPRRLSGNGRAKSLPAEPSTARAGTRLPTSMGKQKDG